MDVRLRKEDDEWREKAADREKAAEEQLKPFQNREILVMKTAY